MDPLSNQQAKAIVEDDWRVSQNFSINSHTGKIPGGQCSHVKGDNLQLVKKGQSV